MAGWRAGLSGELETAGLLAPGSSLRRLLYSALRYVRAVASAPTLEASVNVDHVTGMPTGVTGRILFREPDQEEHARHGFVSVDEVIELADRALVEANLQVWLVLDRLDVAFSDSEDLEANALRALFRVYAGLRRLDRISLKVFLRSDVWERVTRRGFREASHVTKSLTIAWTRDSLLHLIVRRLIRNHAVRMRYGVTGGAQLSDIYQRHLFYAICQRRSTARNLRRGPDTFGWILSLVSDGTGVTEPRELIHLFNAARDAQVRRLEMGQALPGGETLLDLASFGEALTEVSQARLHQTIYAEHPRCRPWIERLHGGPQHLHAPASRIGMVDERAGRRAASGAVGRHRRAGAVRQPQGGGLSRADALPPGARPAVRRRLGERGPVGRVASLAMLREPFGGRRSGWRMSRARGSLLYWPLAARFQAGLAVILIGLLLLLQVGVLGYAYGRLGLDRTSVWLILLATFAGSAVNVPIAAIRSARQVSPPRVTRFFGLLYVIPPRWVPARTVIAVNVGGALVPAVVSAYLVVHDRLGVAALVAVAAVAVVARVLARPVPGVGIVLPGLIPPLAAAAVALALGGGQAPAVAYVAGVLGTLVGADLLNLHRIGRMGAPLASIGGAGTFDGVLLSGIAAVLIAGL